MTQTYRTAGVKFTRSCTHKAKREGGGVVVGFFCGHSGGLCSFLLCPKFCLFFVGLFHLLLPIDFLFLLSVSLSFLPLMYCATFPQIFPPPLFSLILFSLSFVSTFSSLSFPNRSSCSLMSDVKIICALMHSWYSAHIL